MNRQKKLPLDLLLQIALAHAGPYTEQDLYAVRLPHAVAHSYTHPGPHPYETNDPNIDAYSDRYTPAHHDEYT